MEIRFNTVHQGNATASAIPTWPCHSFRKLAFTIYDRSATILQKER